MINFLENGIEYGSSWTVSATEKLSKVAPAIFKRVKSADVVMSPGCHENGYDFDGSLQIALRMDTGGVRYLPLSTESILEEGDQVEVSSIVCIELTRPGDEPCYKADGELLDENDEDDEPQPKKKARK